MSKAPLTECKKCSSIWSPGTEEWEVQECSRCGWSPGEPIYLEDEDDDYDEFGDEPEDRDEEFDPNDSRNI